RGDLERVPDRPGVVGPRAGVQQDRIGLARERVEPLHERALVIGVKEAGVEQQLARMAFYLALELGQRERAVEQRIAPAELVEVDAMHDLDAIAAAAHRCSSATASRTSASGISQPTLASPGSDSRTNGTLAPRRFLSRAIASRIASRDAPVTL